MRHALLLICFACFSAMGVYLVSDAPDESCVSRLSEEGYKFQKLSGYSTAKCNVQNPVKLIATPTTSLNQPVTISCSLAHSLGAWLAEIEAKSISHVGGYNCRKIAGSPFMSQHSYGNAIDIVKIDGVPIKIKWEEAASKACNHFTNVLTPATDNAHSGHLHLDNGFGVSCYLPASLRSHF